MFDQLGQSFYLSFHFTLAFILKGSGAKSVSAFHYIDCVLKSGLNC